LQSSGDVEFIPFERDSLFDKVVNRTPLSELNIQTQYAMWKPPSEYTSFITRGPKAIHTAQQIGQKHIHFFEGSYRGFFLHKDQYQSFHKQSPLKQAALGPFKQYMRTVVQASVNTVDVAVANSEWTADIMKSIFGCEADEIIYPLMPTENYSPEYKAEDCDNYFLYLGLINPHHRTEQVVRAFNNLPYTLKLAGDGWQIDELKKISSDSVEFIGYVTGEKKKSLLANATALVNPTDHSFGRVLVESLASGTPVISVDEGYPSYLLKHGFTGILYESGVENLIQSVNRFVKSGGVSASTSELVAATEPFRQERNMNKWRQIAD
jgi:glycosyltransferase involved in cell wall biosynthesis